MTVGAAFKPLDALVRQHAADAAYLWRLLHTSQASLTLTASALDDRHRVLQAHLDGLIAAGDIGQTRALEALKRFGGAGEAFVLWNLVSPAVNPPLSNTLRAASGWTAEPPQLCLTDRQRNAVLGIACAMARLDATRFDNWVRPLLSDVAHPYVGALIWTSWAQRAWQHHEVPDHQWHAAWIQCQRHPMAEVRMAAHSFAAACGAQRLMTLDMAYARAELAPVMNGGARQPNEPDALALAQAQALVTICAHHPRSLPSSDAQALAFAWLRLYAHSVSLRGHARLQLQQILIEALRYLALAWPWLRADVLHTLQSQLSSWPPLAQCWFVAFYGQPALGAMLLPHLQDGATAALAYWALDMLGDIASEGSALLASPPPEGNPGPTAADVGWQALVSGMPQPAADLATAAWRRAPVQQPTAYMHIAGQGLNVHVAQEILATPLRVQAHRWAVGQWLRQRQPTTRVPDTRLPNFSVPAHGFV